MARPYEDVSVEAEYVPVLDEDGREINRPQWMSQQQGRGQRRIVVVDSEEEEADRRGRGVAIDDGSDDDDSEEEEEEGTEPEAVDEDRTHNHEWNDTYVLSLGLDPEGENGVVRCARCKFCDRFGKQAAGPRKRNPAKKTKMFTNFRVDNVVRHHDLMHGRRWQEYLAIYRRYDSETRPKQKKILHAQLVAYFTPRETVLLLLPRFDSWMHINMVRLTRPPAHRGTRGPSRPLSRPLRPEGR
eukprot:GHVU01173549.1.p1 GENE.GHVU01173549.1~~GHVU01173549.1.p1  ORF type:complete len:242 (+),score=29.12 GHVU01173549.1:168-893(+)